MFDAVSSQLSVIACACLYFCSTFSLASPTAASFSSETIRCVTTAHSINLKFPTTLQCAAFAETNVSALYHTFVNATNVPSTSACRLGDGGDGIVAHDQARISRKHSCHRALLVSPLHAAGALSAILGGIRMRPASERGARESAHDRRMCWSVQCWVAGPCCP